MKKLTAPLGILLFFAAVGTASATSVTYNLTTEFSGAQQPANVPTAVFDDENTPGTVVLTLTFAGPSTTEFIQQWMFNFDGDPDTLGFVVDTNSTGGTDPVISTGTDAFKADGDGLFDIRFDFDQAPPADRFRAGDTIVVTISGVNITASDFDVLSTPDGGSGPFPTAAHVGGVGQDASGSGWVTIPEPSGAILFGIGTLLAGAAVRRRS